MSDTKDTDKEGLFIQEYTINILPAVYSDPELTKKENSNNLQEKTFEVLKGVYEAFYRIPLKYNT